MLDGLGVTVTGAGATLMTGRVCSAIASISRGPTLLVRVF